MWEDERGGGRREGTGGRVGEDFTPLLRPKWGRETRTVTGEKYRHRRGTDDHYGFRHRGGVEGEGLRAPGAFCSLPESYKQVPTGLRAG